MIYNRTVRFANDYGRGNLYSSPSHQQDSFGHRWRRLQTIRLIIFPDAGFSSRNGSRSIEGSVDVLVEVISRDGLTACHGTLLDHRCARYIESESHLRMMKGTLMSPFLIRRCGRRPYYAKLSQALVKFATFTPLRNFRYLARLGRLRRMVKRNGNAPRTTPNVTSFRQRASHVASQFLHHFCFWQQLNGIINNLQKNRHIRHYCFDLYYLLIAAHYIVRFFEFNQDRLINAPS